MNRNIIFGIAGVLLLPFPEELWPVLYTMSLSFHFGSQIWMTFVSGISLYKSLEQFGKCQLYFKINLCLSLITILSYLRFQRSPDAGQLFFMAVVLVAEFIVVRYKIKPLLRAMDDMVQKHDIASYVGARRFRRIREQCVIANVISIVSVVVNVHHMASLILIGNQRYSVADDS